MGPHEYLVQLGHWKTGWERAWPMTAWNGAEAAEEFARERHASLGYPEAVRVSVKAKDFGDAQFYTVSAIPTEYRFATAHNA